MNSTPNRTGVEMMFEFTIAVAEYDNELKDSPNIDFAQTHPVLMPESTRLAVPIALALLLVGYTLLLALSVLL